MEQLYYSIKLNFKKWLMFFPLNLTGRNLFLYLVQKKIV